MATGYIIIYNELDKLIVSEQFFNSVEDAQLQAVKQNGKLYNKEDWITNYHFKGKYISAYTLQDRELFIDLEKVKDIKAEEITTQNIIEENKKAKNIIKTSLNGKNTLSEIDLFTQGR